MNVAYNSSSLQEAVTLRGTVERILYSSGDWGLALVTRGNQEQVKVKGKILPLLPQCEARFTGEWEEDKRNPGEYLFQVDQVEIERSTTRKGLIAKLSELAHVGRQRALHLIETFGDDPKQLLSTLRTQPDLVAARISGITKERAQTARRAD